MATYLAAHATIDERGTLAIPLPGVGLDLHQASQDELDLAVRSQLPVHSAQQARRRLHQVELTAELTEGDLVLVPDAGGDTVTVAELRSAYAFVPADAVPHQFDATVVAGRVPVATFAPDLQSLLRSDRGALNELRVAAVDERVRTVAASGMDGFEAGGPLAGFSPPVPFEGHQLEQLTDEPGVHLVWAPDRELLYIGRTGQQRRRLRQHLAGDRQASILHQRIGEVLDHRLGRTATREEVRDELARHWVSWLPTDDPFLLKASLVERLQPRFEGKLERDERVLSPNAWADVLDQVRTVQRASIGEVSAPHKPLVLLWWCGHVDWESDPSPLLPFTLAEAELHPLAEDLGVQPSPLSVEQPFWRLQFDGVWEIHTTTELAADASGTVSRSQLIAGDVRGGATRATFATVRAERRLLQQLEEVAAELLEPETRELATSSLLWDGWSPQNFVVYSAGAPHPPEQLPAEGVLADAEVILLLAENGTLVGIGEVLWSDEPEDDGPPSAHDVVWYGLDQAISPSEIRDRTGSTLPLPAASGPAGARRVANTPVRLLQNRFQDRLPSGSPLTYDVSPGGRSVWLFQGNPDRFEGMSDLLATAQPGDEEGWSVTRYADEMQPGDLMLLWMSGPEAGIYALGELLDIPYLSEANDYGDTFVDFRFLDVLDEPLRRDALREHPVLQDLGVLRFRQATNYRVTEEQWHELRHLLDRGETVNEDAIHLLFKWSTDIEARTIELHRQVAEAKGAVWWGKFGTPGGRAVLSETNVARFRTQLKAGTVTFAFLYRPGEIWRTRLEAITANPDDVETDLLPDYYGTEDCNLFVRISEFEKLEPDHATQHLVLVSDPDPTKMPGALGNQRTPLLVRERSAAAPSGPPPQERSMAWLEERTKWSRAELKELTASLRGPSPQVILAGPPGTGKTHVAKHVAEFLTQNRALSVRTVQFHPSYGYEEFIEGLRPVADDGELTFKVTPGVVRQLVDAIGEEDHEPYVLIIDEMNRANLSRVFGELMYLFEYRNEPIQLQHTPDFALPPNLAFIGTMNTADRSIRSIDIALRRRFEVFECPPNPEILRRFYDEDPANRNELTDLVEGFEKLNGELTERLDRHHTVGHTFFMTERMTAGRLRRVWHRKLGPLIEEYFFDQPDVAAEFTPERFWELG